MRLIDIEYLILEELANLPRDGSGRRLGRMLRPDEEPFIERYSGLGYFTLHYTGPNCEPIARITPSGESWYLTERKSRRMDSNLLWRICYNLLASIE